MKLASQWRLALPVLLLLTNLAVADERSCDTLCEAACNAGGDCCEAACDCGCSLWTARAKFLYLKRDDPDSAPLLVGDNGGATLFDASQYDFDWEPGVELSIMRQMDCCHDLEVRYFGIFDATASESFTSNVPGELAGQPITIYTAPFTVDTRYTTEINSLEVNWGQWHCSGFHYQYGFRWLRLEEDIASRIVEPNANVTTNLNLATENNLYGFQVGADGVLWDSCCWRVVGFAKGGIYYVDSDADFGALDTRGLGATGSASDNDVAFIGELGLDWVYDINCCWSLTLGAQLLWIDGVAVASDQLSGISNLNPIAGTASLTPNLGGDVLFYGFSAGLVKTW